MAQLGLLRRELAAMRKNVRRNPDELALEWELFREQELRGGVIGQERIPRRERLTVDEDRYPAPAYQEPMERRLKMLADSPSELEEAVMRLRVGCVHVAHEPVTFGPRDDRARTPLARRSTCGLPVAERNSRHSPLVAIVSRSHRRIAPIDVAVREKTVSSRACENEAVLSPRPNRPRSPFERSSRGLVLPGRIAA